jgi:hypothetical protein
MRKKALHLLVASLLACLILGFGISVWAATEPHPYRLPAAITDDGAKRSFSYVAAPTSPDERTADYAAWLSAFTLALVIVSAVQMFFLIRADRTARIIAQAASMSANAARDTAEKMIRATDLAEKQMLMSELQADIQKKQHALGRLQFLAAHRPRLRVRHVSVDDAALIGNRALMSNHGKEIKGSLVVVNTGGTKATIVDSRYRIYFSNDGLPVSAPYDTNFRTSLLSPGQVLDIGESCAAPILDEIIVDSGKKDGVNLREFERGGWQLYVMGQIRYQDEGGADRVMGFCRLRHSDGRFRAVNDSDYEYDD